MDAVGKPDPLHINHKLIPLGIGPVPLIAFNDGLQDTADIKIVLVILGKDNVTSPKGGLTQIVDQLLLPGC
jgi:hypothetical protein